MIKSQFITTRDTYIGFNFCFAGFGDFEMYPFSIGPLLFLFLHTAIFSSLCLISDTAITTMALKVTYESDDPDDPVANR